MAAIAAASLAAAVLAAATGYAGPAPSEALKAQLVGLETGFYEGWKAKSTAPFDAAIADDGLALAPFGPIDKATQLKYQAQAGACEVKGYTIKAPRVQPVSADTALLLYTLEQDAMCGTFKVPSPISNISLYARRGGRWVNVLRVSQPLQPAPAASSGGGR